MVPSKPPSFFKVLVDPSTSNLPLPPDFVTMYFKNKIPNDPIIQSLNGEHAWGLKIKKVVKFTVLTMDGTMWLKMLHWVMGRVSIGLSGRVKGLIGPGLSG
ncbi:hypothetical protein Tco_0727500 [Tanacetum coccineum]|uniref:Uncharacterized protein n=1 Tax=Tanacetum coccineum TaxID=301880 RepID=A0ABQ4YII8_9ASTR